MLEGLRDTANTANTNVTPSTNSETSQTELLEISCAYQGRYIDVTMNVRVCPYCKKDQLHHQYMTQYRALLYSSVNFVLVKKLKVKKKKSIELFAIQTMFTNMHSDLKRL